MGIYSQVGSREKQGELKCFSRGLPWVADGTLDGLPWSSGLGVVKWQQ